MGIFCFGKSRLLRGQDNDLSLVDGIGVHKTVGVALENGLVLHHIAIGRLGDSAQRIASLDGVKGFAAGCDRSIDAGNLTQRFGQNKRCALRQLCALVDLVKLFSHAVGAVVVQPFISFKLEVILSFLYAPPF